MSDFGFVLVYLAALVLGVVVHEFSHALAADRLGDPTPRMMGRLTLNPLAHFDLFGGLMLVFSAVSGYGFGWGKPVPVDPRRLRGDPRVAFGVTALAGPMANLFLAGVAGLPIQWGVRGPLWMMRFLYVLVVANVALAVFNLLPLYPLDGFSVLRGALGLSRTRWAWQVLGWLDRLAQYGALPFFLLLLVDQTLPGRGIIWTVLGPVADLLIRLAVGG